MFIVYFGTGAVDGFIDGLKGSPYNPDGMAFGLESYLNKKVFDIIGFTGVLIYALAKDKVFDEYMIKLRLESMYIVFFGTLIYILLRIFLSSDWQMSASFLFEAQVLVFLLVNKVRKYIIINS
ncbi:hypothetical protein [Marivirga harenae]|uniref:hypothetical protein n=1 Tax=Marivirga harenae TaxID=2010992 RepID=UPI0026E00986|nr:hypothetical protein [Marivirga harenae]WKV10951.1 hypothetical protein Q3Y49_12080 [Marivirga harenae]